MAQSDKEAVNLLREALNVLILFLDLLLLLPGVPILRLCGHGGVDDLLARRTVLGLSPVGVFRHLGVAGVLCGFRDAAPADLLIPGHLLLLSWPAI